MPETNLENVHRLFPLLQGVATASSDFLKSKFGNADIEFQKGRDIKLKQDKLSQDLIVSFIRKNSDLPILTEEGGWVDKRASSDEIYWAVDPLDGSYNFKKGIPLCCVSIALCKGLEPIAGCVNDFMREEIFLGTPQDGLSINGNPVMAASSKQEVLSTGMPISTADSSAPFADLQNQAQDWKKLRMIGSAALSLSWVSARRFDGYREIGIRWWDVAAGLALIKAAGGTFSVQGQGPEAPLEVEARHF